jgi:RNA binding exosome subunit
LKGPIMALEVTYLVHATEDEGKVDAAVSMMLGRAAPPEREMLEGHFGNRIVKSMVHLTGEEAGAAFRNVLGILTVEARKEVTSNIRSFIDEHSALFLRLDKQRLVAGAGALGAGDAVRIKVKPRKFLMAKEAGEFYLGIMEGA